MDDKLCEENGAGRWKLCKTIKGLWSQSWWGNSKESDSRNDRSCSCCSTRGQDQEEVKQCPTCCVCHGENGLTGEDRPGLGNDNGSRSRALTAKEKRQNQQGYLLKHPIQQEYQKCWWGHHQQGAETIVEESLVKEKKWLWMAAINRPTALLSNFAKPTNIQKSWPPMNFAEQRKWNNWSGWAGLGLEWEVNRCKISFGSEHVLEVNNGEWLHSSEELLESVHFKMWILGLDRWLSSKEHALLFQGMWVESQCPHQMLTATCKSHSDVDGLYLWPLQTPVLTCTHQHRQTYMHN